MNLKTKRHGVCLGRRAEHTSNDISWHGRKTISIMSSGNKKRVISERERERELTERERGREGARTCGE